MPRATRWPSPPLPRAIAVGPEATRVVECADAPMTDHNTIWQALTREAASAAEHMAIGATAVGRARHDRIAVYAQAFFALSVGLERSAKLALAIDHALEGGEFPTRAQLRNYGPDLRRLLHAVENVRTRRDLTLKHGGRPDTEIHAAIVKILTAFATN